MSILNRPGWVNQITVNEARSSRHAGSLDLSIVQKQLADKKIGIPYRDARRFLFDFLRDRGIVDGTTPQAAKDINAIIGALVTSGKITPEVSNEWNAYIADISNLQQFIGSTRTVRGRLANDASENVPATPDEIKKRMEDRKFERKLGSATSQLADIEGFDEYKLIKINVLKNMLSKAEQNDELAENPKFVKCVEYISNLVEVSTSPEDLESKLNKIIDETENNELLAVAYTSIQALGDTLAHGQPDNHMQESTNKSIKQPYPQKTENIKLSPQAQDRLFKESRRKDLQHKMAVEQKYFGY